MPPWGLMDTLPGVTAIRAGAMLSPWGATFTPVAPTEMSACTQENVGQKDTLPNIAGKAEA